MLEALQRQVNESGFAITAPLVDETAIAALLHALEAEAANLTDVRGGLRLPLNSHPILRSAVASGAIGYSAATGRGPGIAGESNDSVRQFWRFGTLVLAGAGLIAIVWTGATLLVIPPCL